MILNLKIISCLPCFPRAIALAKLAAYEVLALFTAFACDPIIEIRWIPF